MDVGQQLRAGEAHGLTRLLGAFGEMGSFNDLMIHPVNGHRIEAERVNEVNDKLRSLQSRMYQDAGALLHDLKSKDQPPLQRGGPLRRRK